MTNIIRIDEKKSTPIVTAKVGNAHLATYRFKLDLLGKGKRPLTNDNEARLGEDPRVKKTKDLHLAELRWDIRLVNPALNSGKDVNITIETTQDGNRVGNLIVREGNLTNGFHIWIDSILFEVV